jgi:hypothetical protein
MDFKGAGTIFNEEKPDNPIAKSIFDYQWHISL